MKHPKFKRHIYIFFSNICISCSYFTSKIIPKGFLRLLSLLPIISIFFLLPLNLSSMHLGGTTAFFIAWLANFKLLLLAFGHGPLSSHPHISLPRFIALASLPIMIRRHPKKDPSQDRRSGSSSPGWVLNYGTKGALFALLMKGYDYSDSIHPKLLLCLYCLHVYLCLEITLALAAVLAKFALGVELEPQFDKPYLSASLQDFWGRRWNVMVTSVMRPTGYDPVLRASARVLGRKWAPIPAVFGTFAVSALMHELIYFYLGRVRPTWEITCFFLLHGACLTAEIAVKKACGGSRARGVPRVVAVPLTVGFLMVTGLWLFLPQLLRFKADVRAFEEYAALAAFAKRVGRAFAPKPQNATHVS